MLMQKILKDWGESILASTDISTTDSPEVMSAGAPPERLKERMLRDSWERGPRLRSLLFALILVVLQLPAADCRTLPGGAAPFETIDLERHLKTAQVSLMSPPGLLHEMQVLERSEKIAT